ncbi:M48 family metalloprotease [Haloarchaeobius sp. DFWS5]|uniref:M48 family metalloprotease n=1 Tax=Haloarchaeobius sp. DFWS5 TaxID=3446114 RepID=UPI003EBBC517
MSLVLGLLVHLLVAAGWYVAVRYVAARLLQQQVREPVTAVRLRHLRRLGYTVALVVNLFLASVAGTALGLQAFFADLPQVLAPVVVGAGVFVFAVLPSITATALAVAPYRGQVRHWVISAGFVLWWVVVRAIAVTVVIATIVTFVRVVPSGWPRIAGALAVVLLSVALSPLSLSVGLRTREPTTAERARISHVLPDGVRLRVVDPRTRVGCAFAAGVVPGFRYVFLTETVFELLSDDELAAVVAHEVSHHRRNHVAMRFGLVALLVVPMLVAVEFGLTDIVRLVGFGIVPYAVLWFWTLRRTEFVADRDAARAVSHDAMVRALEVLLDRKLIFEPTGTTTRLLDVHPAVSDRIDKLETPADT